MDDAIGAFVSPEHSWFNPRLLALDEIDRGQTPVPGNADDNVDKTDHVDGPKKVERFISSEHISFGAVNKIQLIKLPNGIELTFGQIVALAGDYYGVPEEPIIHTTKKGMDTKEYRKKRFLSSHATLAHAEYSKVRRESDELISIMKEEKKMIDEAIKNKRELSEEENNYLSEKYDRALGGTWALNKPIHFGRMMKLAVRNFDHFQPFAREAYEIGHELAMEKAREASHTNKEHQIEIAHEAYSIEAFACHFLTDSFASGHMRVPRLELHKNITPSAVGDYLSKYMHDEDGKFGLNVRNKRGDQWIAYGDGFLFYEKSAENRRIAMETVEISVGQIVEAFRDPDQSIDTSKVTDLIPFIDESKRNNYPMFQMRDGNLVRRANLNDLADSNVTNFYGVPTANKLRSYNPLGSCIAT